MATLNKVAKKDNLMTSPEKSFPRCLFNLFAMNEPMRN